MWDCHGLEAVQPVPDPAMATWARLTNTKPPQPPNLLHWRLRAQFNPQRYYEIWIFDADSGIDVDHIRQWFESTPQMAADRIRAIGHCFYSNRAREENTVIR